MAVIAWWGGRCFEISPSVFRSFTNLQITGASATEDKESKQEQYSYWTAAKATEITLTAHLNAFVGCDVQREAMAFVEDARWGKKDYFYTYLNGNYSKLLPMRLRLIKAVVTGVEVAPNGQWTKADVQITLKSLATPGGASSSGSSSKSSSGSSSSKSSSGGSSSSNRQSVKTTDATTKTTTTSNTSSINKLHQQKGMGAAAVKTANSAVRKITTAAKTASKATSGGGGINLMITR